MGAFPVNVKKMLLNQVGQYKQHAAWTRFQNNTGLVSVPHAFSTTAVQCQALTYRYPFDRPHSRSALTTNLICESKEQKISPPVTQSMFRRRVAKLVLVAHANG
jgi:hypothetical protein